MAKVSDFLDQLAVDTDLQVRYDRCTDEPMDEFGLDDAQKDLIRYGSPQEVRDYLSGEHADQADSVAVVYVLRMLPPR
ncbi:MAG TPA: hypothetical protein VFA25_09270 [Actinomycetota bacterium]|jgi:hypothetical protein|nr:hypothetical protein [Actinomycetota bacterium]